MEGNHGNKVRIDPKLLAGELERIYSAEEAELAKVAKGRGAIHGSVMPRTYVGPAYGRAELAGRAVPRVLVMSINQSRQGQEGLTKEQVRQSMREIRRDGDRFLPDGFGPRGLAANLCRWIFMQCGVDGNDIRPQDIHDSIAYDNFVKWPFNVGSSRPDKDVWPVFYPINKAILEALQPEIILCLGRPMYDHIWRAVEKDRRYRWEKNVSGWCFSLFGPWGRCELGWCYHYSNPIWPKRIWRELCEQGTPPEKAMPLLRAHSSRIASPVDLMRTIDKDKQNYPWWDDETYAGKAYTEYNPYQKAVAWNLCKSMTARWSGRSGPASVASC